MPIRPYRCDDLRRLKQITEICFDGVSIDRNIEENFGQINGRDWRFRKLRHIDADVAGDHARGAFVFETDDGDVVGYITTRLDREAGIGWIPNVAVDPTHQGAGVGRQLMEHAIDFMIKLFEAMDPQEARGRRFTARELVAEGERLLGEDEKAEMDHAIKNRLQEILSQIYGSLGGDESPKSG